MSLTSCGFLFQGKKALSSAPKDQSWWAQAAPYSPHRHEQVANEVVNAMLEAFWEVASLLMMSVCLSVWVALP